MGYYVATTMNPAPGTRMRSARNSACVQRRPNKPRPLVPRVPAKVPRCLKTAGSPMGTEQSPEEHTMHRLPTCDSRASRVERGIFLSLALSAVALIAMTAWHGLQFASARDQILAPLT